MAMLLLCRLLKRPSASVDARYSNLANKFKLEASLLPATDRHENEDWVDPITGLAARVNFASSGYASGWAMNALARKHEQQFYIQDKMI